MKLWYHTDCLFESFKRARATTKKIEDPEQDIENWDDVEEEDRKKILGLVEGKGRSCSLLITQMERDHQGDRSLRGQRQEENT